MRKLITFAFVAMFVPLLSMQALSSLDGTLRISTEGTIVYGQVYLGAWLQGGMPDIYDKWVNETGRGLAIYATMACFGYPDTPVPNTGAPWITLTQRLQEALPWMQQGLFDAVSLTWETSYTGNDTGSGAVECTQRVANGDYDNYIRATAIWIKTNFPYKLFIRLDHEFNLETQGWSQNATAYILAWRRVVDIFRTEGVAVEWVWCANWNDNPSTLHYQDYYSGDDYVDWVGVDIYANSWGLNAEEMLASKGSNNLSVYDFALAHGKKFMIGEWGLNLTNDMTDQENAVWLSGMFDAIEERPNVKAIIHWGGENWCLLNYPSAIEVYRNRVNSSKYTDVYP
jgi:hypothetical protein